MSVDLHASGPEGNPGTLRAECMLNMLPAATLLRAFSVRGKTWLLGALVAIASASTKLIIPIASADDFVGLQHNWCAALPGQERCRCCHPFWDHHF